MLAASEAGDVFALLEGGARGGRDAVDALAAVYGAVREPWLTRALLLYHARSGSTRALELLARAPDHHARHLLDALHDQLRAADRPARHHALAALAPLLARRPPWLHRLPTHPLARELVRAARLERDPLPLLHALLALAALLPAAPALAAPLCPDLADALLRPAALDPPPSPPTRVHLQLAQLALFHALYATHPCTLLDALRNDLGAAPARDAWERDVAPLLASVRLHPALVTGSRQREADVARWARLEPHDVLAECRRLSVHSDAPPPILPAPATPPPPPAAPTSPAPGSGAHAARTASSLRPGAEPWFPLGERCGADSAPHTPLPVDADTVEPPEAAVEATPENTPARETRAQFRFPTESGAARAIGRRVETSPAGGEAYSARLARVASERRAVDSPVPFGGAPPTGVLARPEPRSASVGVGPGGAAGEQLAEEDREVLELTASAPTPAPAWPECDTPAPALRDPRARTPAAARAPARRGAAPARRAASCPPRPPTRSQSVAVQTVDVWPEPYEFLVADFYRVPPPDMKKQPESSAIAPACPSEKLDAYLSELYAGRAGGAGAAGAGAAGAGAAGAGAGELAEQLALVHAQLMYERWRREAHAERNRRLLGRCRRARAVELHNHALRERARDATRERDDLRARLAREPAMTPAAAAVAAAAEREARLEAALAEERAARHRAEAALHEAEQQRARDASELRRTRGESHDAARHVEALARAALAADRRADSVRRLRRELLVLGEREARLARAARASAARAPPPAAAAAERALRAALQRADADAEAAGARADAAAARAHELEAALATRDAAAVELKRAARLAADEAEARLRAVRDKYAALLRVVRTAEARRLERLAAAEMGSAPRRPAGAGAGAAGAGAGAAASPPELADCSRVRRLLDPGRE